MSQELHPPESVELIITPEEAGGRLDAVLAGRFPEFSRAHLQRVIAAGGVRVDGTSGKASQRARDGQRVCVTWIEPPRDGPEPEDVPLEILYEDDALVAINKPPGMVVHPAKGHWSGTLAAALRHHFDQLSTLGGPTRPGIVHRLDRDTSGVIVVAKTDAAHAQLAEQFEQRTVEKEYFALVRGAPDRDRDHIDLPIGPHPHQREKMAARPDHPASRPARTFYEVIERFDGFAAVRVLPKTGRTHQIRVHLLSICCPVLCDRLYGREARITVSEIAGRDIDPNELLLDRQALHAARIGISHPTSGQMLELEAPLPDDVTHVLTVLRAYRAP